MTDSDGAGESITSLACQTKDIVWSKGDRCQVKWSGDGCLYKGVVRRIKRRAAGRMVALVKFDGYGSEDNEEFNTASLMVVAKSCSGPKTMAKSDSADEDDKTNSFFKPLTGREDFNRLEEKYGCASDSDEDAKGGFGQSSDWISPTPYQTKGKVSHWKLRSPVKTRAASQSQPRKGSVAKGGSPKKAKKTGDREKLMPDSEKVESETTERQGILSPGSKQTVQRNASSANQSPITQTRGADNCAAGKISRLDHKELTSPAAKLEEDQPFSPENNETLFQGFDEEDMEKPNFTFPAPCAKVPFALQGSKKAEVPASLNQYLRDYQREGIQFLYSHYSQNRGAILGDDMGLGKTVQVIGFLSALMSKQGNRVDVMRHKPRFIRLMSDTPDLGEESQCLPVLIIGPGSVLYNWLEELETWAHFVVRKYHGVDKAACLVDVKRGKVEVVVTTFETCRDNIKALNGVKWEAVIVDEVHRIKDSKAQTTKALRTLKCTRRFGLTGTALQNNMTELWCLLDWAQPDVLGSCEEFEEEFVLPIERGQKQNATKRELAEARRKKEEFAQIRGQMLLRRTKKLIADQLPVKTDRVVFCRLSALQLSVYRAVLSHPDMLHVLRMDDECPCGSGRTRCTCCFKKLPSGKSLPSVMFSYMHVLLKTSNHAALLTPHARMSPDQEDRAKKLCALAFKQHPEFLGLAREAAFRTLSDPKYCGKMKVLAGMLPVFAKSHSKVLVFSHSTRLLDILEQHVISEGHEFRRIDGSVTGRKRQEIVREFNNDANIFLCLVSTKAGGLGLNMTGANKVVIFDPNWNPSHDLQAQDRAYRIGQRRDVEVYRLISAGSIEENIYLRQIYKQQLDTVAIGTQNARRYFQGIQGDADNKGELFGVKNMFRLGADDSCLTRDILNRNAKVEAKIAGYDMAPYVPSNRELELEKDEREEEGEMETPSPDAQDSSDEESLQAYRYLFDLVSDDEEKVLNHHNNSSSKTGSKQRAERSEEPKPSSSGLHNRISKTTTSNQQIRRDELNAESPQKQTPLRPSKPTTRQRKTERTVIKSMLKESKSATSVLDFLEEGKESEAIDMEIISRRKLRFKVPEKEDAPQLGEESMPTLSFSSVNSVFEQCGVVHVHENPAVVGASRVEDHMTRCAMADVFERSANSQAPAALCEPMSPPSEEEEDKSKPAAVGRKGRGGRKRTAIVPDHNTPRAVDHGRWRIMVGQTPTAICKKHWNKLKEKQECDEVTLAQRVLEASAEERLIMLKEMYRLQHDESLYPALEKILSKSADPVKEEEIKGNGGKAASGARKTQTKRSQGSRRKPRQATSSKKPQGRKKRVARGLLYNNVDEDSELTQVTSPTPDPQAPDDNLSSDDSGFNIGAQASLSKRKVTPRKQRGRRVSCGKKRQHSASLERSRQIQKPDPGRSTTNVSVSMEDMSYDDVEGFHPEAVRVDVDVLLSELGKEQSRERLTRDANKEGTSRVDTADRQKLTPCTRKKSVKSFLDDLFVDPGVRDKTTRKPPPGKGQCKTEVETKAQASISGADKILDFSNQNPVTATRSGNVNDSADTSELFNNSTLRDEDLDCFGEPSQWKKRKRVVKTPEKKIDRLMKETTADYLQLFESGRLVKKRQRERSVKVVNQQIEVCDHEVKPAESSGVDPSASLFS